MNLVYLYYKVAFKPKMGASWFINSSMGKQCLGSIYQVLKIRLRNQQGKSWSTRLEKNGRIAGKQKI